MPPTARAVVRRRNWRWSPGNEHTPRRWVCFPGPGTIVAEFDTLDAAEADWGKREADVRRKINPFECGPMPMVSSLPEPVLRDFLMDTGIEPPAPGIAWDAWWTANRDQLSDEQQARLWQATDKVRFFEITEEAAGPEVHVVVDVNWEERGVIHVANYDGGELIRACRHASRAGEIARGLSNQRRLTIGAQEDVPFANCRPCNAPDPFTPGSTHLTRLTRVPFSEVLTIPFDDTSDAVMAAGPFPAGTWLNRSERLAVVLRLDYALGEDEFRNTSADVGVPVKAYTDWERAQAHQVELDRKARESFNPFDLSPTPETLGEQSRRDTRKAIHIFCNEISIPVSTGNDWHQWWTEHVATLSEARRKPFWDVLDRVQFYSVVSVAFEG